MFRTKFCAHKCVKVFLEIARCVSEYGPMDLSGAHFKITQTKLAISVTCIQFPNNNNNNIHSPLTFNHLISVTLYALI